MAYPPLFLSWSALRSWEACKQQQHLRSRRQRSPAADTRIFFPGNVVDRVMRQWLDADTQEPGAMVPMVEEVIETALAETGDGVVKWRHASDRREVTKFCTTLVQRLEPILYDLVVPHAYEHGMRFKAPIRIPGPDGEPTVIYLVGEMDVLTQEAPSIYGIYDLKGTANPAYIRKTLGQGVFYDVSLYAMSRHYPVKVAFIQPMVETEPVVWCAITTDDRRSIVERVVRMAHAKWAGDNTPTEDVTCCGMCDVRHGCIKYRPVVNTKRVSLLPDE